MLRFKQHRIQSVTARLLEWTQESSNVYLESTEGGLGETYLFSFSLI